MTTRTARLTGDLNINALLAFVFGVVFVATLLTLAIVIPNPTLSQLSVFRTVLALSAAGVGAVIPGFIHVQMKSFVRAGGALALFVIVYFFSPAIQAPLIKVEMPTENPMPTAQKWLQVVDSGDLKTAWDLMDKDSKALFARNDFEVFSTVFQNGRFSLGDPVYRVLVSSNTFTSDGTNQMMPPKGAYASFTYTTKFSKSRDCRAEAVTLRATNDLKWVPFGHQVSSVAIPCPQ
jgi:hypothetical protein